MKCKNCGHEEKYHTGKDNWVRKSSSCHFCKCRKFAKNTLGEEK